MQARQVAREEAAHKRIDTIARYVRRTNRCPICRQQRPSPCHTGITCGNVACIAEWLGLDNNKRNERQDDHPTPSHPAILNLKNS